MVICQDVNFISNRSFIQEILQSIQSDHTYKTTAGGSYVNLLPEEVRGQQHNEYSQLNTKAKYIQQPRVDNFSSQELAEDNSNTAVCFSSDASYHHQKR